MYRYVHVYVEYTTGRTKKTNFHTPNGTRPRVQCYSGRGVGAHGIHNVEIDSREFHTSMSTPRLLNDRAVVILLKKIKYSEIRYAPLECIPAAAAAQRVRSSV